MMRRFSILLMTGLLLTACAVQADETPEATDGQWFLQRVAEAVDSGEITAEEGLLYKFHYAFDQDRLPAGFRPENFTRLKCGTPFVMEFMDMEEMLSAATRQAIENYLNPEVELPRATYISPSGYFRLTYYTSGGDAVPPADNNPANGIPDFVETIATYCDYSYQVECFDLQFEIPPVVSYYEIRFEDMQGIYGYTSALGGGRTTIALHRNFLGFPPNDDPDGNQWGAAKVTCASSSSTPPSMRPVIGARAAGSNWMRPGPRKRSIRRPTITITTWVATVRSSIRSCLSTT